MNKKNKLTIKSNWDKALTISDKEMNVLRGGASLVDTNCDACEGCQPGGNFTLDEPGPNPGPETGPNPDPDTRNQ